MMENLLKPDSKNGRQASCPKEPPAKIKALSVAAKLAGLTCISNFQICFMPTTQTVMVCLHKTEKPSMNYM